MKQDIREALGRLVDEDEADEGAGAGRECATDGGEVAAGATIAFVRAGEGFDSGW
jgi:hypothetical protein